MVWDALFWSLSQKETYVWWAAVQLVGLVAFPLTFAFFRFLPDRGYAFSKPLGLVLDDLRPLDRGHRGRPPQQPGVPHPDPARAWAWPPWPWSGASRDELGRSSAAAGDTSFSSKALFAVALAVAVSLRAYVSGILWNEKPMDFAFLNAILRADSFPPRTPGSPAIPTPCTSSATSWWPPSPSSPASRPASPSTWASPSPPPWRPWPSSAWCITYSLCGPDSRAPSCSASWAVGLLLVLANMEGVFELLPPTASARKTSTACWTSTAWTALSTAREPGNWCREWYPTEWLTTWWRATRISTALGLAGVPHLQLLPGATSTPTRLSIPFVLVALRASPYNFLRWQTDAGGSLLAAQPLLPPGRSGPRGRPGLHQHLGTCPPSCAGGGHGSCPQLPDGGPGATCRSSRRRRSPCPWPLYCLGFCTRPSTWTSTLWAGVSCPWRQPATAFPPVEGLATRRTTSSTSGRPSCGPPAASSLPRLGPWREHRLISAGPFCPALALRCSGLSWSSGHEGPAGFAEEAARAGWWFTMAFHGGVLTVAALACGRIPHREARQEDDRRARSSPSPGRAALLLLLGTELFWVQDPVNFRSNTVFRLGYQAWILLSISGAFGCPLRRVPLATQALPDRHPFRLGWRSPSSSSGRGWSTR